jgi:HAD superfamily hydrolase (TIGR01509 family)
MIDAVIFDMDGLLIDSEYITFQSYKEVCLKYGNSFDMTYYATLLGRNAAYIESSLAQYLGSSNKAVNVMKEVHKSIEIYIEEYGVPLKKGVKELLGFLKSYGIKMAVATSSSRSRAVAMLDKGDILAFFEVIVCGDEVKQSKPDPEIFLKAVEALGGKPSNTIVIEDSESGIIGAHQGGMKCINVPDLKVPSDIIIEKADYIAEDLIDVMTYICKHPVFLNS